LVSQMKAVVFEGAGRYAVTERPVPEIRKTNEMLVKVLAASICGTDVHILHDPPEYDAAPGIILGHEFVGEVVAVGSDCRVFKPGDRLICDNNISCGVCAGCQSGNENVCENVRAMGVDIDGVFAQYAVVPEKQCAKISRDVPIDRAIFAEPLNCVMGGIKKLKIMLGDSVLVLGGGPIGMYYAALCKKCGAGKVFVSEVSELRAGYAKKIGVTRVINPARENLKEVIMQETGRGVDIVIDAVGTLINDALDCVRPAGQVLLFGLNASRVQEICQSNITRNDVNIIGNFIGSNTLISVAKMLDSGLVDFSSIITHRLPLEEFGTGLEAMRDGTALEVVLYPWDDIEKS